jgi:group II intron reverse transcriptase/maturase
VQTAADIVLGSIFEADLAEEQYAYRRGKNAIAAVEKVIFHTNRNKHLYVVDADLSSYFDTIPHQGLMKAVARRVADGKVLHLIKMWLEAPVEEKDDKTGQVKRTTYNKDNRVGTPQGAPISPLFSNLYMREFIARWKDKGFEEKFGGKIVNYADDLVICCRIAPKWAMEAMEKIMTELKLTVNEAKTRVCVLPMGAFVFLGYEFKQLYSFKKRKMYIGAEPSKKAVKNLTVKIHDQTARNYGWMDTSEMSKKINRMTRGWANYYSTGAVSKAYRRVSWHTLGRYRQWLKRKERWKSKNYTALPDWKMCKRYGLIDIRTLIPKY